MSVANRPLPVFEPLGSPEDSLGYLWQREGQLTHVGFHPCILPVELFDLLDGQSLTNNSLADHRSPSASGYAKWYESERLAYQALLRALLKIKARMTESGK